MVFNFQMCKMNKLTAYLLGFLWADGYIQDKQYGVRCEIVSEDAAFLSDIFKELPFKSHIRKRKSTWKETTTFYLNDKKVFNHFVSLGYTTKSVDAPVKPLLEIPEYLHSYFFRGYFDGDGCFYFKPNPNKLTQFIMCSSYNQDWSSVIKLFDNLNIKYGLQNQICKNTNSSSKIRVTNKKDIIKLGEYIYKDYDGIGLKRKYDKYLEIANS